MLETFDVSFGVAVNPSRLASKYSKIAPYFLYIDLLH